MQHFKRTFLLWTLNSVCKLNEARLSLAVVPLSLCAFGFQGRSVQQLLYTKPKKAEVRLGGSSSQLYPTNQLVNTHKAARAGRRAIHMNLVRLVQPLPPPHLPELNL